MHLSKHTLPLLAFPLSPTVAMYLGSLLLLRYLYEKGTFTPLLYWLRRPRASAGPAPAPATSVTNQ